MAYVKKLATACGDCGVVINRRPGSRGPLPTRCPECWRAYRAKAPRQRTGGTPGSFTSERASAAARARWAKTTLYPEGAAERSRAALHAVTARWAGHERKKKPRAPRRIKACDWCGCLFATSVSQVVACSRECQKARRRAFIKPYVSARRRGVRRGEWFTREEIVARDDYRCGLCGGAINPKLSHPDPHSASLDHVTPISRGGEHTRANVRAAHLVCNMRRGTKDDSEYALALQAQAA